MHILRPPLPTLFYSFVFLLSLLAASTVSAAKLITLDEYAHQVVSAIEKNPFKGRPTLQSRLKRLDRTDPLYARKRAFIVGDEVIQHPEQYPLTLQEAVANAASQNLLHGGEKPLIDGILKTYEAQHIFRNDGVTSHLVIKGSQAPGATSLEIPRTMPKAIKRGFQKRGPMERRASEFVATPQDVVKRKMEELLNQVEAAVQFYQGQRNAQHFITALKMWKLTLVKKLHRMQSQSKRIEPVSLAYAQFRILRILEWTKTPHQEPNLALHISPTTLDDHSQRIADKLSQAGAPPKTVQAEAIWKQEFEFKGEFDSFKKAQQGHAGQLKVVQLVEIAKKSEAHAPAVGQKTLMRDLETLQALGADEASYLFYESIQHKVSELLGVLNRQGFRFRALNKSNYDEVLGKLASTPKAASTKAPASKPAQAATPSFTPEEERVASFEVLHALLQRKPFKTNPRLKQLVRLYFLLNPKGKFTEEELIWRFADDILQHYKDYPASLGTIIPQVLKDPNSSQAQKDLTLRVLGFMAGSHLSIDDGLRHYFQLGGVTEERVSSELQRVLKSRNADIASVIPQSEVEQKMRELFRKTEALHTAVQAKALQVPEEQQHVLRELTFALANTVFTRKQRGKLIPPRKFFFAQYRLAKMASEALYPGTLYVIDIANPAAFMVRNEAVIRQWFTHTGAQLANPSLDDYAIRLVAPSLDLGPMQLLGARTILGKHPYNSFEEFQGAVKKLVALKPDNEDIARVHKELEALSKRVANANALYKMPLFASYFSERYKVIQPALKRMKKRPAPAKMLSPEERAAAAQDWVGSVTTTASVAKKHKKPSTQKAKKPATTSGEGTAGPARKRRGVSPAATASATQPSERSSLQSTEKGRAAIREYRDALSQIQNYLRRTGDHQLPSKEATELQSTIGGFERRFGSATQAKEVAAVTADIRAATVPWKQRYPNKVERRQLQRQARAEAKRRAAQQPPAHESPKAPAFSSLLPAVGDTPVAKGTDRRMVVPPPTRPAPEGFGKLLRHKRPRESTENQLLNKANQRPPGSAPTELAGLLRHERVGTSTQELIRKRRRRDTALASTQTPPVEQDVASVAPQATTSSRKAARAERRRVAQEADAYFLQTARMGLEGPVRSGRRTFTRGIQTQIAPPPRARRDPWNVPHLKENAGVQNIGTPPVKRPPRFVGVPFKPQRSAEQLRQLRRQSL